MTGEGSIAEVQRRVALDRWRRVRSVLLQVADIRHAADSERERSERALGESIAAMGVAVTRSTTVYGRQAETRVLRRIVQLSDRLSLPVSRNDQPSHAIVGWAYYLDTGESLRQVAARMNRRASGLLSFEWRSPEKTLRERMWLDLDGYPKTVTLAALPGIERITDAVEKSLHLPAILPPEAGRRDLARPDAEQRGPDRHTLPGDRSEFITDVTVPDGSVFDPREPFIKIWRIRNAGRVAWTNRYLTRLGSSDGTGTHSSPDRVRISDTPAGESVDITVPMRAALLAGTSASTWKMTDSSGREFFPDRYRSGLRCEIVTRGAH